MARLPKGALSWQQPPAE